MRKFKLFAVAIIILFTLNVGLSSMQVNAKPSTIKMTKSMANTLKKGKLPHAKGKIGMTYKTIKKKEKGKAFYADPFNGYKTKKASYGFYQGHTWNRIGSNQKIIYMEKSMKGKLSNASMNKYFKKVKVKSYGASSISLYKAGNYYVKVNYYKGYSTLSVGTKKAMSSFP